MGHSCRTLLWDTLVRHSCGTLLWVTCRTLRVLKLYYKVASSHLTFHLHRLLRVLKLYYKVASSQLPAPQIAPRTKVVLPSHQFSSSSSPDTPRTRQCSPAFRALDAHNLRRGLRGHRTNRTLACISRTRHAALWLGLVLFLSSSCHCLGRVPELCGWALWPGSVSGSCPCLGRAPELCGWSLARLTGEECGRTNSDVNADKNSLMKQFALGVKVGRTKKSIFD